MNDSSLWRRRLWVWLPALVFFAVNVGLFSTYRLVYAGQAQALRNRLAARETELSTREARAAQLGALVIDARENQSRLDELFASRLSTERQRFTRAVAEIKELAAESGLDPTQISYPGEEIAEYGLIKRYVSFTVAGSYSGLRQFVDRLEQSRSFVTLEQVSLNAEDTEGLLQITLRLSTLFGRERSGPAAAVTASGAGGEAAP